MGWVEWEYVLGPKLAGGPDGEFSCGWKTDLVDDVDVAVPGSWRQGDIPDIVHRTHCAVWLVLRGTGRNC